MTLHDAIATDAITVFCNTDDFAETVIYSPYLGEARPIAAVVIRDGWETNDSNKEVPVLEVHVANDPDSGIACEQLRVGAEYLTLPLRIGQTPTKRTITRIISNDEGMLVLECR